MTELSPNPGSRLIPRDHTPVRIAVAGLGSMGEIHLKAAAFLQAGISEDYYKADLPRQIKRLHICAVCDPNPDKQKDFPSYPFYQNWDSLLEEQKPHIALLASPTTSHFELAMKALEAGVHCLVEKPITPSLKECQTLLQVADAQGCRVQAGHVERYNPVAIKVHSLISKGELEIGSYSFERSQALPPRIPDDIITDKLIHDLDLAIYLFGPVTRTETLRSREVGGRVMEIDVQLEHANGIKGTLFVSWLVPAEQNKRRQVNMLTLAGERICGDFIDKTLSIDGVEVTCGVQGWISPVNNQIKDQLADFLAYCLEPIPGIPPPLLSREEMLESIRIIQHIRSTHHV
jgi:predicted dehydrogenase